MLPEQIKLICQAYGITPKKSKGQNFLINESVIDKIINAAKLTSNDTALEVGPGLGILTEELIKKSKKVISIELDKKLFDFLKVKFVDVKNLNLINEDVLKINPSDYGLQTAAYKIVANIPYNITSIFLKKFISNEPKPQSLVLLVQKEVAERVCAKAGKMSLLSISIQLYGNPEIIETVDKTNFFPQPAVDSAILKIAKVKSQKDLETLLDGVEEKRFWQIAKVGFSAKRKQLANNLASGLKISTDKARKAIVDANLEPLIRAQNLEIKDWINVAKNLEIHRN